MKIVKFLRGLFAWLSAILAVVILFGALVSRTTYQTLLSYDTYASLMQETRLAERSRGMIANFLFSTGLQAQKNAYPVYLQAVPMQSWDSIAAVVFPAAWVDESLSGILRGLTDWFNSDAPVDPPLLIQLGPVKDSLSGPAGAMAILPLLDNVPACPTQGTFEITFYGSSGLLSCWPAEQSLVEPAARIARDTARLLPEQITLESLRAMNLIQPGVFSGLAEARARLAAFATQNTIAMGLGLLLAALSVLLNSAPLRERPRGLAYPAYALAGLLTLLILAWHAFMEWGLGPVLTGWLGSAPLETQSLLLDSLRGLAARLEQVWTGYAAGILAFGLAAHGLTFGLNAWAARRAARSLPAPRATLRLKKPIR